MGSDALSHSESGATLKGIYPASAVPSGSESASGCQLVYGPGLSRQIMITGTVRSSSCQWALALMIVIL
jgi:hypothetical protein